MDKRKYVSIDPGGTTGWAVRDPDGTFRHGIFESETHHEELYKFLVHEYVYNDDDAEFVLICERFNYQRRDLDKGVHLVIISREYIGVCELFRQQRLDVIFYMSQVGNKEFFNNRNLRDLNLYYPTEHERDAVSHLLWYLVNIERDHSWLEVKKG